MRPRIPDRVRRLVRLECDDGCSPLDVAELFSISVMSVSRIRRESRALDRVVCSSARLGVADREEISRRLAVGDSVRAIAAGLGRSASTVSREINRNGGRERYRAVAAQRRARACGRRSRRCVFETNPVLAAVVENWLEFEQWSPAQISARLRVEFPDDETMRVSAETIYQALYVYGRGGLRKELAAHLRSRRNGRRPHTVTARNRQRSSIPDPVSIRERPDEVEDRLVPGHWEGDLIMGRNNKSQVATLVERTTGLVMLAKLDNKQADTVATALSALIERLPEFLRGSLTWDRGTEMAAHAQLTLATGIKIYFCDPHAPWQRGSNENTNGLLRQYLPRTDDLSQFSQTQLDEIAHKLNRRPRARHDFLTPLEVFDQLVLH